MVTSTGLLRGETGASLSLETLVTLQHNFSATGAPTANDDSESGYSVGSVWIANNEDYYVALDVTADGAVWKELAQIDDLGAAAFKGVTGDDDNAVTGTAGTDGNLAQWNADGDLVDAGSSLAGTNFFLDEDDLASDSDTQVASQQSIKAYVDNLADEPRAFTGQQYFALQTLTDGANIDWNLNTQQVAQVTLGGNRTLNNPTNIQNGASYLLAVIQDGTGSRELSYGTDYLFGDDGAPTLSTSADTADLMGFVAIGGKMLFTGIKQGFDFS